MSSSHDLIQTVLLFFEAFSFSVPPKVIIIAKELMSKLYMKIINENYRVKNYMKEDHRSYRSNFCRCEKKA